MKIVMMVLILVLTSSSYALDLNKSYGSQHYISSYSNGALFKNLRAGEAIRIYTFGSTNLFCGVSVYGDAGNLLLADRITSFGKNFISKSNSLHMFLCLKTSGVSGYNFIVIEDITKRVHVDNDINNSDSELLIRLQNEMKALLN